VGQGEASFNSGFVIQSTVARELEKEKPDKSRDAEDAPQGRPADKDLSRLQAAVCLAQEMGTRLGSGGLLLRALPASGKTSDGFRLLRWGALGHWRTKKPNGNMHEPQ
jgi:hypothetical protein